MQNVEPIEHSEDKDDSRLAIEESDRRRRGKINGTGPEECIDSLVDAG